MSINHALYVNKSCIICQLIMHYMSINHALYVNSDNEGKLIDLYILIITYNDLKNNKCSSIKLNYLLFI